MIGRLNAALVEQPDRFMSRKLLCRVQKLRAAARRRSGARARDPRRPRDGHGDRPGGKGGDTCFRQLAARNSGVAGAVRIGDSNGKSGDGALAVLAVQHIRRMRGGAQGQLMLGADGHAYVVKFQNNPQHTRVLANEFLATKLAAAAGLAAPQVELIDVSSWLVDNTPELEMELGRTRERCQPGLQFGSRFVGGLMPGQVVDYLPEEQMAE